jgi:alpha-glucosidase
LLQVPNHTSDQHEWFKKSASREPGFENFYVWKNCTVERLENETYVVTEYPNNWVCVIFVQKYF